MTHTKLLKIARATLLVVLIIGLMTGWWPLGSAQAQELNDRSIQVSTAVPSASAKHTFQFTYASTSNIGSVAFEYCDNSPIITATCNVPPGLNLSSVGLISQTGNIGFGYDSADSTPNEIVISRSAIPAVAVPSTYTFSNVVNPSDAGHTEFVRITTYASTDASGSYTDNGSVAFSTVSPFNIGASVPPFLRLCVGVTVAVDCSTTAGDSINLGTLSDSQTSTATSQFAGGTNSIGGYGIFALGTTMTSGNNIIPAMPSPSSSAAGQSQFGINLRSNSRPPAGTDPTGPGTATPAPSYDSPNLFAFNPGDLVASDSLPSDYRKMTVSYVVNVSGSQPPGVYATTLTYLATATF